MYRNDAGGGPSHRRLQHANNLVKIARVVPEISCQTDRQTDRQTDTQKHTQMYSLQYFHTPYGGKVKNLLSFY